MLNLSNITSSCTEWGELQHRPVLNNPDMSVTLKGSSETMGMNYMRTECDALRHSLTKHTGVPSAPHHETALRIGQECILCQVPPVNSPISIYRL